MDPVTMAIDPMAHLTTGAVIVWLMQWAKDHRGPLTNWIADDTVRINRCVSILAAAAVSFGITSTGSADVGWVIHIPPVDVLLLGAWTWLKQFTAQEVIYNAAWKKPALSPSTTTVSLSVPPAPASPLVPPLASV